MAVLGFFWHDGACCAIRRRLVRALLDFTVWDFADAHSKKLGPYYVAAVGCLLRLRRGDVQELRSSCFPSAPCR